MIKRPDQLDWSKAKTYKRKSDGLEVLGLEAEDDFHIAWKDHAKKKDHDEKKHGKECHGGQAKGKKGDMILKSPDFFFACSRVDIRDQNMQIFSNKFTEVASVARPKKRK